MGDIVLGDQNLDPSVVLLRAFHDHRELGNDIDHSYRHARDTHPLEFSIIKERALGHGHQLGVPGDRYNWRYEIMLKGHHRFSQNGVSIGRTGCATCVVVKYPSHNFSEIPGRIRVGGSGGRIKEANRQRQRLLQDQEMTVYNQALHRSIISGLPVRLYAYMPNQIGMQYLYLGLVRINSSIILWTPEHFQCYEYRMVRFPGNAGMVQQLPPLEEVGGPGGFILEGPEQVPEGPDGVLAIEWHDVPDVPDPGDLLEGQQHYNSVNSMQEKVTGQPSMLQGGEISVYQLDRLLPKLYKAGHRVVFFSQMTRLMDILGVYLELHGFKFLRYDGSTKPEERETLLKQFNAPDSPYFMFLQSTRAGSLGLDLHTADTVIIFDSDWNLPMDQQADDRTHCIGKKRVVRVFLLVSVGSVEEAILEHAKPKMGIGAKVIQAGLLNTTFAAQDSREMLEDMMRKGSLGRDVTSEREINRLAARSVKEFWMFERMDEERRQKENNRSRLMEENEVPDWAYAQPDPNDTRDKRFDYRSATVSGKKCWKPTVYANTVSESQWTKAVKYGEPVSKLTGKRKMKENLPPPSHQAAHNNVGGVKKVEELKSEHVHVLIERTLESTSGMHPRRFRSRSMSEVSNSQDSEVPGYSSQRQMLTWKIHKKRRSRCIYMPPHPVLCSANIAQ